MIRRPLIQPDLQELSQAQRICHSPRDPTLAFYSLEKTDQQQAKVHPES